MRERFLRASAVIDWEEPGVLARARQLAAGRQPLEVARACFEWVRDAIAHTSDHELEPVTCRASEVLEAGTGFCYAKSHLLAALLRANGIPSGLVYQRLIADPERGTFCLHGLNAIWLPGFPGPYRVDARGHREDLARAGFSPPIEQLVYGGDAPGETTFAGVWAEPVPVVVRALEANSTRRALLMALPDAVDLGEPDFRAAP
jgi:transglutaminase-like putative cysteine protease